MVIKFEKVKEILSQLKDGRSSREAAERWAIGVRGACDARELEYFPLFKERKIWEAVLFIELYAEKISPETYLYSQIDLEKFIYENEW